MKIYKCPVCDELSDDKYSCCDEPCGILIADTDDRKRIAELEKQNEELDKKYIDLLHTHDKIMSRSARDYNEIKRLKSDIDVLNKNNKRLRSEIERMRCCGNCNVILKTIYYDCPNRIDCTLGLGYSNVCFWQPRNK